MALNKIALAQNMAVAGAGGIAELLEAQIGGALMGAFVAKDLMGKEDVEQWLEHIEKFMFYASGGVVGAMELSETIGHVFWVYLKAQAMFVCVYKRYWGAKTFIRVEGNQKIPETANVGTCTLLEAPECKEMELCNDMTTFWDR